MSNKKRIKKLLQAKYRPSRKVIYFDHHKFGYEFGKAAGNAVKQLKLITKAFHQIGSMMSDFNKEYKLPSWHNEPISEEITFPVGVVHTPIVQTNFVLTKNEQRKIIEKLEQKRTNKNDLM